MAEWPIEVVEVGDMQRENKPLPPGATLKIGRAETDRLKGYHFVCPCCGGLYWVPTQGSKTEGAKWHATGSEDNLTLTPSLLCSNPNGSGGHYWLTNGVLREV